MGASGSTPTTGAWIRTAPEWAVLFSASGGYGDPTNGIYPAVILGGNGDSIKTSSFYNGPPQDSGTPLPYTQASQDPTRFNGGSVSYQPYHTLVPKIYQWNFWSAACPHDEHGG